MMTLSNITTLSEVALSITKPYNNQTDIKGLLLGFWKCVGIVDDVSRVDELAA